MGWLDIYSSDTLGTGNIELGLKDIIITLLLLFTVINHVENLIEFKIKFNQISLEI